MKRCPFLLGTTSFIFNADILTNVGKLAPIVDDVELVLFVVDKDNNLPSQAVLKNIGEIAEKNNIGFTVHLPLHLSLGDGNEGVRTSSVDLAVNIIHLMNGLTPRGYIIHLNPPEPCEKNMQKNWSVWVDDCCESLKEIVSRTVPEKYLCVENLESYDIARLDPILDSTAICLCLDIGHLWIRGKDPVYYIDLYSREIRVVHLHGIDKRDHSSLIHTDKKVLKKVLDALKANHFTGVLTLEVFCYDDLITSLKVLESLKIF